MRRAPDQGLVFISYAHSDLEIVRPMIDLLKTHFKVWWDDDLRIGETWRYRLQQSLVNSRCVVVFWTKGSVESDFVWSECDHAKRRGVLLPVKLQADAVIPLGFDQLQYIDLSRWNGDTTDAKVQKLLTGVSGLASRPRRSDRWGSLQDYPQAAENANSAAKELLQVSKQLRTIGGILRKGEGPVDGLLLAIGEVYATYDAVNLSIEAFLAPSRQGVKPDAETYAEIELGSVEDLVQNRLGHCTRIGEEYLKVDGLREWLADRLNEEKLREIDDIFQELTEMDYTLFDRMGEIGKVLTAEAEEICNLLISGQAKSARHRIAVGRKALLPVHRQVRGAMKHLRETAAKLGYTPEG